MGVVKAAIGDAILTATWVFMISTLKSLSFIVSTFLGLNPLPPSLASLFIATVINTLMVLTASLIGRALGGASFNPSSTVAFYAAGLRPHSSLSSFAVQFPAQAAGGALGAKAIITVMPDGYKHMLGGPHLKVDMHTGAVAEGVLTLAHNLAILVVMTKGPKHPLAKIYLLSLVTAALVVNGSAYTGPALNPANAFGWAYLMNKHNTLEQFYVYWVCPFVGATFAALLYRFLFLSSTLTPKKQKKA